MFMYMYCIKYAKATQHHYPYIKEYSVVCHQSINNINIFKGGWRLVILCREGSLECIKGLFIYYGGLFKGGYSQGGIFFGRHTV